MCTCVGGRNLVSELCALVTREAALLSRARPASALLHALRALTHCSGHMHARALMIKVTVFPGFPFVSESLTFVTVCLTVPFLVSRKRVRIFFQCFMITMLENYTETAL